MTRNQPLSAGHLPGRRAFLASAAALATPTILPSTVFATPAPSDRITLGCIGTGFVWNIDTSAFMSLDDVRVVAVCDVDRARREKAKATVEQGYADIATSVATGDGVAAYNDFRELLEREDIDAVSIATPDHWHALIARAACDAGKDVYCQKPLTYSIAEGQELVSAVRRNGTVFQVGSQQRSMYNFRFACELVRNGRIGKLTSVEVGLGGPSKKNVPADPMPVPAGLDYNLWLGPAPWAPYTEKRCHYTFRWIKDYAYGLVTDWGAHHVDTAQWGMGTDNTGPVHVTGEAEFLTGGLYDTPGAFAFTCTYADGVRLHVGDGSRFPLGIKFIGTEGWVFITRGEGGVGDISAEPSSILTSVFGRNDIRLYRRSRTKRGKIIWRPGNVNNTIEHYIDFIDSIRARTDPACPVEVGHRSISVCHLAKISMELGRPVNWDPDTESFPDDAQATRMLSRPLRPLRGF